MQLRPYQSKAVEAIENEYAAGKRSTLLVLPTGCGKTFVFSNVAIDHRKKKNKPVLVLAHRSELLDQAGESLRGMGMAVRVEKAQERAAGRYSDAVVASVQTLCNQKRLDAFDRDHFGLVVIDEAHHAPNKTYKAIIDHFASADVLGVTATPNRHDEIGLRNIFQSCAFQYSLAVAIRDKWLCPIRGMQVEVQGIHLEAVKVVAGEFSQPEMDAMLRDEETLQGMVRPTIELAGDRPTIVFTPGVEHAHEIASCFNRILGTGRAVAVDGSMDPVKRKEQIARFKSGDAQFIVNVGVLTEGFDHPPTACIALFRPTRSLGLFAQMIGRATRLFEGKTDALVLDFVGMNNTVRTVTVMDVLDGTILSDAEHKKAQELQKQGFDAEESLAKAKYFVAHLDSIQAKMRALSTSSAFDVLQMFSVPSAKGLYGGDKATEKQLAFLANKGVAVTPELEKGEASKLIDAFVRRQDSGLATFKQLKYLRKLGYVDNQIDQLTFERAGELINNKVKGRASYAGATRGR
jgi:superfamily II DNA or RNA helicase